MSQFRWGVVAAIGLGVVLGGWAARAAEGNLKVGDKAPAFTLQGSDGKTYSLDQFKGKKAVVLAWFPKAKTGGCTAECKSLRSSSAILKPLNVAYFTASVDDARATTRSSPRWSTPTTRSSATPARRSPRRTASSTRGRMVPSAGPSTSTRTASSRRSTRRSTPSNAGPETAAKVKELGLAD